MNKDARDYFWAVIEAKITWNETKTLSYIDYLNILADSLKETCEVFDIKPRKAEQSELEASKV